MTAPEPTDAQIEAFRTAWHEADAAGQHGGRVRAGLRAALVAEPRPDVDAISRDARARLHELDASANLSRADVVLLQDTIADLSARLGDAYRTNERMHEVITAHRAARRGGEAVDRDGLIAALNMADVDFSAREAAADAGHGDELGDWFGWIADAALAFLADRDDRASTVTAEQRDTLARRFLAQAVGEDNVAFYEHHGEGDAEWGPSPRWAEAQAAADTALAAMNVAVTP